MNTSAEELTEKWENAPQGKAIRAFAALMQVSVDFLLIKYPQSPNRYEVVVQFKRPPYKMHAIIMGAWERGNRFYWHRANASLDRFIAKYGTDKQATNWRFVDSSQVTWQVEW